MWGFVPYLPLHRWGPVLQLTTLPFPAAARASLFSRGTAVSDVNLARGGRASPYRGASIRASDSRAHVPSDPTLISLGPSRLAIPYRSRSAAEGFGAPRPAQRVSAPFFHPQRRGFSRDTEAQRDGALIVFPRLRVTSAHFGLAGCTVPFLMWHMRSSSGDCPLEGRA